MNDVMNKLIKLANGEQYVILAKADYEGITYYLGNNVIDNDLGDDIAIFKIEENNGTYNFIIEPNLDICQKIIDIIEKQ